MEKTMDFYVKEEDKEKRLDSFLAENNTAEYTRSYIGKLIEEGYVLYNGQKAKASIKLKSGDHISLIEKEAEVLDVKGEDIPLDIVVEDEDLLVVNKPRGMVVHPAPGHYTGTLVNAVIAHSGTSLSSINGVLRPGIIHRIDKDTSGLLLICKNDFFTVTTVFGCSGINYTHSVSTLIFNAIIYLSIAVRS